MRITSSRPCTPRTRRRVFHIEERLLGGQLKIVEFFERVRVVEIAEADVARFRDPRVAPS